LPLDKNTDWSVWWSHEHGPANSEPLSQLDEGAFLHCLASKDACPIAAAEQPAPWSVGMGRRLDVSPKEETTMTEQKITPCLWFDFNAEQAVDHYLSIFPNSRILSTARYGEFASGQKGAVMTIFFEIDGQRFLALNGGPQYKFTPAISLMVNCDNQAEIEALWQKLAEGGEHVQCGWLTDKFGVSWQIVPRVLPELLGGDAERTDRVMRAVMSMKKLDIAQMEEAASPN
jgi:predicted 3-demethylubiquinone-9 3-methyltransferase (glyoxalase superfamily)